MNVVLTPNIGEGKGKKRKGEEKEVDIDSFPTRNQVSEFFSPAGSGVYKSSKDVNFKNNIVKYKIGIRHPGYVMEINRPKI